MVIKYLLEKEWKQFFRHKFMPKLVLFFPLMIMVFMPWATTLDIRDINTVIVDHDVTETSRNFTRTINASSYFLLQDVLSGYDEAINMMEFGDADLIIEIPTGFEQEYAATGTADILVAINTVNTTKGVLGRAYIQMLAAQLPPAVEDASAVAVPAPKMELLVKNMYNPLLDYKHTMIPGLMVVVILLLCGFMPVANVVQEKELGTIEQINVTPVSKFAFILAKLVPYWIIGLLAMTLCVLLAWLIFGLTPAGSLWAIYFFTMLFILTMSGMGLVISNNSSTMQQATFVMLFFVMIFLLMCGLFTPVRSMPDWAQTIASVTPTLYMVDAMRNIYLKGSTLADLTTDWVALAIMTVVLNVWAILSYRKSS